MHFARII